MLETIRRYWIGFLVLALVILHASIVGLIRYQASLAKKDISCEVDLGDFVAYRSKSDAPIQMSLHAIVPLQHRMKSRQLIELNQAQVRQALEEHLRQFDGRQLADPYLTDLRSQLLEILTQTLGASSVEDIIVTKIRPVGTEQGGLEFLSNAPRPEPRRLVASLRGEETAEGDEEAEHEEGGEHDGDAAAEGHDSGDDHGAPAKSKETASHGKSSDGHAKPAKASSHGAATHGSAGHGTKAAKH